MSIEFRVYAGFIFVGLLVVAGIAFWFATRSKWGPVWNGKYWETP
jgi:hypothetical protein